MTILLEKGSGQKARSLNELFVSFEENPQGAASLAQVHKAVLADGTTVAVKVQHPKVQAQSSRDIMVMEFLLEVVHWLFPDFAFMWLVEEAKRNMPLELDFLNEGSRNAEKVSRMLKHFHFLKVPRIHWDLSTKRVLVMDFVEGGQVNDRDYMTEHGIDVNEDVEIRTNAALLPPSDQRAAQPSSSPDAAAAEDQRPPKGHRDGDCWIVSAGLPEVPKGNSRTYSAHVLEHLASCALLLFFNEMKEKNSVADQLTSASLRNVLDFGVM
ncbi:hypothetical protein Baya_15195 [Bagarius yarrelli]|uniref:AarF domain-containing protein kinase 1 n=1 Tax=Bagarius yarrelli TaxID=175774 RepID=A0A556VB39_BAGYA|nr:hypothetical protein Baya_15195 [Bagarius yarrelli]